MIISNNKKFDPKLHEEADAPAKTVTKYYVGRHGYDAEDNPNIYGVDLIVPGLCYIEVERRFMWDNDGDFPYRYLHIPHRKRKFFNQDMPTLVFTWNHELTRFIRLHEDVIKNSKVIEKSTQAMPKGEHFYEVDINLGRIIKFT